MSKFLNKLLLVLFLSPLAISAQNISWTYCIGGSDNDYPVDLQKTLDGGAIVIAYTNSTDFDAIGNKGFGDFIVIKISNSGVVQWKYIFGGTALEQPKIIKQTPDGGYLIIGESYSDEWKSPRQGSNDIFILKLNNNGIKQWLKTYGGLEFESIGGTALSLLRYPIARRSPELNLFEITKDGGFIFAAETYSSSGDVSGYYGGIDIWLVKCNNQGIIEWKKCLGGTANEFAVSVRQLVDGSYILLGFTKSENGMLPGAHPGKFTWLVKLNSVGSVLWNKLIGSGHINDINIPMSLELNSDGGFFIVGTLERNDFPTRYEHYWIMRLNGNGETIWDKHEFGSRELYFVNKTIDGGIILAGDAPSNDVFKLNSDGQVQWKRSYPLSGECCQPQLSSLTYTSDGGILLDFYYDYFGYRVPCGMCIGCFGASGKDPDNYQIRVFKLDAFGNQQWTKCLGPNRPKSAMAFKSVDLSQTVTLVVGKTDVGGNNGSVIGGYNGKTGVNDVYITGLTNITTGIIPIPNTQTSKIYPNPSNNEIFIEYKPLSLLNKPEVIFRDIHGKILLKKILYKEKNVINIKHFTTGIYMVTIKDGVAERSMTIFKNE